MRLSFSAGGSPVQAGEESVKLVSTQISEHATDEEKAVAHAVLDVIGARLAALPETCSTKVQVYVDIQADRV